MWVSKKWFTVVGIKPKVLLMLDQCSTTELLTLINNSNKTNFNSKLCLPKIYNFPFCLVKPRMLKEIEFSSILDYILPSCHPKGQFSFSRLTWVENRLICMLWDSFLSSHRVTWVTSVTQWQFHCFLTTHLPSLYCLPNLSVQLSLGFCPFPQLVNSQPWQVFVWCVVYCFVP